MSDDLQKIRWFGVHGEVQHGEVQHLRLGKLRFCSCGVGRRDVVRNHAMIFPQIVYYSLQLAAEEEPTSLAALSQLLARNA